MRTQTILKCQHCGEEFIRPYAKPSQRFCGRKCATLYRIKHGCEHKRRQGSVRSRPAETLDEKLNRIERYNESHGTHLTYGQFVAKERMN